MITLEFVKAMLEEFRQERLIHKRYAFQVGEVAARLAGPPAKGSETFCACVEGHG